MFFSFDCVKKEMVNAAAVQPSSYRCTWTFAKHSRRAQEAGLISYPDFTRACTGSTKFSGRVWRSLTLLSGLATSRVRPRLDGCSCMLRRWPVMLRM